MEWLIRLHSKPKEKTLIPQGFSGKRMMGIEPTLPAWKAGVLPLNYIRVIFDYGRDDTI
jgi:hypothetical protein